MIIRMLVLLSSILVIGCGFHLRGAAGDYQLPYKTVKLDCSLPIICPGLTSAIKAQHLTKLVNKAESAEVVIEVSNEQTSRDSLDFNQAGQIASYILTYQVTARIYNRGGEQIGNDIVVKDQQVMNYNNSLILSAQQQEDASWDLLHQNVINSLLRRLVYFKDSLGSYAN